MKGKIRSLKKAALSCKKLFFSAKLEKNKRFNCCMFCFFFRRNDKVIVFSDNVFALKKYAEKLKK